jgi:hypothetical protein
MLRQLKPIVAVLTKLLDLKWVSMCFENGGMDKKGGKLLQFKSNL